MKLIPSSGTRVKKKRQKTSKLIVWCMLAFLLIFTISMIAIYVRTGGIPDTLVQWVFTFCGAEAGFLGLIRNSDNKYQKPDDSDAAG